MLYRLARKILGFNLRFVSLATGISEHKLRLAERERQQLSDRDARVLEAFYVRRAKIAVDAEAEFRRMPEANASQSVRNSEIVPIFEHGTEDRRTSFA
jgi:predicted nucleotidyltransferase